MNPKDWPHPPLDLLPLEEYKKLSGENQLEIGVQKGCLFNCSFCAEKSMIPEPKIYSRDPQNLVSFISRNIGSEFYLDATTFTQEEDWALKVCHEIQKLDAPVRWKTVTRIDKINEKIALEMSRAGCYKIGFGIETLSESLQKRINKPIKLEQIKNSLEILKGNKIIPRAFLILGIPKQTREDIQYTQEKLDELGVEFRWKEYVPFEKIPFAKTISDFDEFSRDNYRMYNIPGLAKKEYIKLLGVKR